MEHEESEPEKAVTEVNRIVKLRGIKIMGMQLHGYANVSQLYTQTDFQRGLSCVFNVFVKAMEILTHCPNRQDCTEVGQR